MRCGCCIFCTPPYAAVAAVDGRRLRRSDDIVAHVQAIAPQEVRWWWWTTEGKSGRVVRRSSSRFKGKEEEEEEKWVKKS